MMVVAVTVEGNHQYLAFIIFSLSRKQTEGFFVDTLYHISQ